MMNKTERIFLVGFMGSGKTTLGKPLARILGFSFIDLDIYIEKRYYKSINQLFQEYQEEGFRKIEKKLLHEVAEIENVVIATGGGTPCFFDNMDYMNEKGKTVYLNPPFQEILKRLLVASQKRPLIQSKSTTEIEAFIKEQIGQRSCFYERAFCEINSTALYAKEDIQKVAEKVVEMTDV